MLLVTTFQSCISFLGPLCREPEKTAKAAQYFDYSLFASENLSPCKGYQCITNNTTFVRISANTNLSQYELELADSLYEDEETNSSDQLHSFVSNKDIVFQSKVGNLDVTLTNKQTGQAYFFEILMFPLQRKSCYMSQLKIKKEKFKVGFVVNNFNNGGVARVSQVVGEQLTADGHSVVFITGGRNPNDYQIAPNIQRLALTSFSSQLYQMTEIKALKLDVIVFQEYWASENYYLISQYVAAGMKVIALHHNVYIWHHIYSPHAMRGTQSTMEVVQLLHQHYPRAHALVALSPFDAVIFKRIGCHSRYIPNPSSFKMREIAEKPKNQILFMGRMSQEKQPDMALDMMKEMALINENAKLVMVGDQEYSIKQRIQNEQIKNVDAVGYRANVNDYYDNAAVFILTSTFEGYPMVVTEAISHGLPVVAFELPYLALMECNVTQVPKRDVKEMAKKVNELLQDEELRQRVARDAQRCVERLNAQVVPRWNDLLDKVVNEYEVDYADEVDEKWVDKVLYSEVKSAK